MFQGATALNLDAKGRLAVPTKHRDGLLAGAAGKLVPPRRWFTTPRLVLMGMHAPPNLGADYTRAFSALFPELARAHGAVLVPFLLEGVAGVPRLNLPDGVHPTTEGHRRVAETVWKTLEPVLRVSRPSPTP